MSDERLLSAEALDDFRVYVGQNPAHHQSLLSVGEVSELLQHIDVQAEQLLELARATVAYDEAIMACAGDPARMATYNTATGDDLDALYFDMMIRARTVLGLPNVLGELAPQPIVPT